MIKWVTAVILASGYLGLFLLMILENLVPPIPSEFIMPMGGYMVSQGHFNLLSVVLIGTLGSVVGTIPLYYWGRNVTEDRLHELTNKHGRWLTISHRDVHRSICWFHEYGGKAILFGRLIPGVRAVISLPAGMCGIRLWTFLFYMSISSLIWNFFLAYAGYFLGSRFSVLRKYSSGILIGVIALILIIYLVRVYRYNKAEDTK
jgi:membrane protein DedA with SNARE-associated domain